MEKEIINIIYNCVGVFLWVLCLGYKYVFIVVIGIFNYYCNLVNKLRYNIVFMVFNYNYYFSKRIS